MRCARLLWYRRNRPPAYGESLYRIYQSAQHARLREVVGDGAVPVVYTCDLGGGWSAEAGVDDLVWQEGAVDATLLRPVTSVKDGLVWEAAFCYYVLSRAGAAIRSIHLRYLRKGFRREPDGTHEGLLIEADISRRAAGRSATVAGRLERIIEVLELDEAELRSRTRPCTRRHCPICAAERSPVQRLEALATERELTPEQTVKLTAGRSGRVHLRREAVAAFLSVLEYPLSFLDFEAYSEAVPALPGVAPWEHVPVVYSLHRIERPGGEVRHWVYAAEPGTDGRAALYRHLTERLGDAGSIIVYGKGFERRMLERLAAAAGDEAAADATAAALPTLIERLVDLSRPFARCDYYDPRQQGSASLKAVYRALVGSGYGDLDVSDGRDANVLYYFLIHGFPAGHDADPQRVLADLKRYCSRDTEALVAVLEKLQSV